MRDVNSVQIIGYLTEDIEVRDLPSGMSVTDLNVQVRSKFQKDDGSEGISSSFHTVTVWGQSAKFLSEYARKGSQVYASGRLKTDSWEDDQGKKKYKTKIVLSPYDPVILLDPRVPLSPLDDSFAVAGGLNRADVLGNVTQDPEIKQTPSGKSVIKLSVATNRTWTNKETNEQQKEAEFHNIVAWGALADDTEKIVKKGQRVFITGNVQTRSWETPDGEKRYTTEINAKSILALGHPSQNLPSSDGRGAGQEAVPVGNEAASENPAPQKAEPTDVPEINYESDIKPEDLPF